MRLFSNKWEYVSSKNKIGYRILVPKSEIKFNKNHNVDCCEGEFEHMKIRGECPRARRFPKENEKKIVETLSRGL